MKDRVIVVMVLRASNKTEERVDSKDGEGTVFMRDGKRYSYKDVAWSGKGDLITLFGVWMMSIGMLRLLGKTT
jgi:hypothetical protein